jgi:hypothetical protein
MPTSALSAATFPPRSASGSTKSRMASEMSALPRGASGSRASTRCTMFSARSCSPAEMKIFWPFSA